jgi:cobalt-zinc-cadmium efflux system protein
MNRTVSSPPGSTLPSPSARLHEHHEGDARHLHMAEGRSPKALGFALTLTLVFAAIEAVTGWMAQSLALISDAGHMLTDTASLALALMAQFMAKRPPSARYSFGFGRAEALAAFVNGLAMLLLVAWIAFEAVQRFTTPVSVAGSTVFIVAAIGLVVNLGVAFLLSRDQTSINTRAALVHVLGDLLGSVAAMSAGAIIYFTGWMQADPLLSLLVCALLLRSTLGIVRESYHSLMEGVPHQIDYLQVGADLEAVDGVLSVHDLHVWDMSPGQPALIGHLEIRSLDEWPGVLARVKAMLLQRHGIDHITLQPEVRPQASTASA